MNNHYEYSLEPIDINVNKNINKKKEIFTHKNYGNIPNYLIQFQLEEIKKKNMKKF